MRIMMLEVPVSITSTSGKCHNNKCYNGVDGVSKTQSVISSRTVAQAIRMNVHIELFLGDEISVKSEQAFLAKLASDLAAVHESALIFCEFFLPNARLCKSTL
jgi:hypothetical protein